MASTSNQLSFSVPLKTNKFKLLTGEDRSWSGIVPCNRSRILAAGLPTRHVVEKWSEVVVFQAAGHPTVPPRGRRWSGRVRCYRWPPVAFLTIVTIVLDAIGFAFCHGVSAPIPCILRYITSASVLAYFMVKHWAFWLMKCRMPWRMTAACPACASTCQQAFSYFQMLFTSYKLLLVVDFDVTIVEVYENQLIMNMTAPLPF